MPTYDGRMSSRKTIGRILLATVRRELAARGNAARAEGARAYMKSAMPFHGVGAGPMRQVCSAVFADVALPDAAAWQDAVLTIWRGARFREERYAAIELTGIRPARPWQTPDVLPMYEELIVTGAWWDYVDTLAAHRVGAILRSHPAPMGCTLRRWARDEDLWKRRTAILAQLTFRQQTDLDLLYACIEPSIDAREFFLRKAIGWALRQYARSDPREVSRYVTAHRDRLSPLSVREALKHVD